MNPLRSYILFFSLLSALLSSGQGGIMPEDSTTVKDIHIPLEVNVYCENLRNSLQWDLSGIDSTLMPHYLVLTGYGFETDDTIRNVIKTQVLDSTYLADKNTFWISNPGYYKLSYYDTSRNIRYSSEEVRIDECSQYLLPDQFTYAPGKVYQPVKNQNVEKIDLVIFNASGTEVFHTRNPEILWDGRDMTSGNLCPPGSYFFNCDVYEKKGNTTVKRNVTGIIDLIY